MYFDHNKCFQRDKGFALANGEPITLVAGRQFSGVFYGNAPHFACVRGHIATYSLQGAALAFFPVNQISNLPDPPRRVKVMDAICRPHFATHASIPMAVADAIISQHPDLEIELKETA